jgi:hypothetical protein
MTGDTPQDGLTLADAARVLGISTRTLRRHIAAGKVKARLVAGPRGQEYRVALVGPAGATVEPEPDGQPRQDSGAAPGTALRPMRPDTAAQLVALVQAAAQTVEGMERQQRSAQQQIGLLSQAVVELRQEVRALRHELAEERRRPWWARWLGGR